MSGRLAGKVAIITGAGSGMGAAMAELFCREGAKVLAADISGRQDDVARDIGSACLPLKVDVSKSADIKAMVSTAVDHFGKLDILCNNAGIQGAVALTADHDEDNFDQVIAVNMRAVFLGMKYAIPHMIHAGGGSIVNTSSMSAFVAFPMLPGYTGSKGGVNALTRVAAAEYAASNIRVNAVAPGAIDTGMTRNLPPDYMNAAVKATPLGRLGTSIEIAQAALFLASDEASFITGAVLPVDGGYTVI
jgi:NAD(P)-dependent dehydrogenase (short-subunit alcohol dehydrogenase family)